MRTTAGKGFDLGEMASPKTLGSSRQPVDPFTLQLQSWKPFSPNSNPKPLDSDSHNAKRPCLSDRTTSFRLSVDMSRLSLFDDEERPLSSSAARKDRLRWKRRRRGSRSVSGRSSDRTAARYCSVEATATCSDFMVAAGATDSSGELFGDANWGSDVSEARNSRRERLAEKEVAGSVGLGLDAQAAESGYGSEPGYRGDAEVGYEDELDEEDEDARFLLWGDRFGDLTIEEAVGENSFAEQKVQCRGRRKKSDLKTTIHSIR